MSLWGGVLTICGHLVFWSAPEGHLQAADGKIVWKFQTGSGVVAPRITRDAIGEQLDASVLGWGGAATLRGWP